MINTRYILRNRDTVKDILLKAASDVGQGMWCIGSWFTKPKTVKEDGKVMVVEDYSYADIEVFGLITSPLPESLYSTRSREDWISVLSKMERCAEGSIALATIMAGKSQDLYEAIVRYVADFLYDRNREVLRNSALGPFPYGCHPDLGQSPHSLNAHNDQCLPSFPLEPTPSEEEKSKKQFEAGTLLGKLFRDASEDL